jgi:hypothetical protein
MQDPGAGEDACQNDCYVKNRAVHALPADIAACWHVPRGLQQEDRLLINLSAARK